MNALNKLRPSLVDQFHFTALKFRDLLLFVITRRYSTFILGFRILSPKYLDWTSIIRARRAYYYAVKKVPAYRSFIKDAKIIKWSEIPFTDKDTYIRRYPTEQRCVNGTIPSRQIMIDESSGSTGKPYDWVRGMAERKESHAFISFFATYCYGRKPWITINAFSLGAWATGLNMGIALQRNGLVKNTGPDISKILHTLEFFEAENETGRFTLTGIIWLFVESLLLLIYAPTASIAIIPILLSYYDSWQQSPQCV